MMGWQALIDAAHYFHPRNWGNYKHRDATATAVGGHGALCQPRHMHTKYTHFD